MLVAALSIGLGASTVEASTAPAATWNLPAAEISAATGFNNYLQQPEIAIAADGTATVVWSRRFNGSDFVVQAATRPPGANTFGPVEDLSSPIQVLRGLEIAVARDGEAAVVWSRSDGSTDLVQACTRPAGSNTFGDAQDLSVTNLNSSGRPDIAIAANGETTVLWSTFFPGSGEVGQARTRPAGSSAFGAIEGISEVSNQSVPRLAVAPDGAATVIWEWEDATQGGGFVVQTASRPAGSSAFGAVTNLSAAGPTPSSSRVATAPDGSNTAVWVQAGTSLQVASSDPTTYPLAVQLAGKGEGKVASSPAGIECGSTCEALFKLSTKVTLTATPAPGSSFTGWSGAGCSGTGSCVVTMSEAQSVTATFSGKKPELGLSLGGPKKVRAGKAFRVGIRVTNRGPKKPTPVGSRATKAETVETCLKVPRKLFVTRVQKGAKTRGRTICWTRASLGTSKWVSYKVSLRSSSYSGGSEALRASATANGESGTTANASRSLKIRLVDPRPAPKPLPPTD